MFLNTKVVVLFIIYLLKVYYQYALFFQRQRLFLQATNHALDKGKTGLLNDIAFWDSNYPDIAYLGIQDTKEEQDDQIYVYEKEGIRIAILNYTYGTNGIPLPEDMPYAVNLLDEQKIRKDMEKANAISDFQIVCPHWGTEYYLDVDDPGILHDVDQWQPCRNAACCSNAHFAEHLVEET